MTGSFEGKNINTVKHRGGGGGSLKDAGISLQILAPTLEKALFWISRQDFLT